MPQLPDLVSGTKLDTDFLDGYVVHHVDDSDDEDNTRPSRRIEYWETRELIGRGGCAEVFLQQCKAGKKPNARRAVKVLARADISSSYLHELEVMAKFSQKRYLRCFVKFLGWYESTNHLYIAMEYFPLGDLQRYMSSRENAIPEADVREITTQILEALKFMHGENFAHRDIKPNNILIKSCPPTGDWWVKLGDFGVSKRSENTMQVLATLKGTMGYIAPELFFQEPGGDYSVDFRAADMWSVGEMVFRMLTKTATFPSPFALNGYLARPDQFPLKRLRDKGVSQNTIDLVTGFMKPSPEARLSSAESLNLIRPSLASSEMHIQSHHTVQATSHNSAGLNAAQHTGAQELDRWATPPATLLSNSSPLDPDKNSLPYQSKFEFEKYRGYSLPDLDDPLLQNSVQPENLEQNSRFIKTGTSNGSSRHVDESGAKKERTLIAMTGFKSFKPHYDSRKDNMDESFSRGAFSPCGHWFASYSVNHIRLWRITRNTVEAGQAIKARGDLFSKLNFFDITSINKLTFSPKGSAMAVVTKENVWIWKVNQHNPKFKKTQKIDTPHSGIIDVIFSSDEHFLVTLYGTTLRIYTSTIDGTFHLRQSHDLVRVMEPGPKPGPIYWAMEPVCFSPDSTKMACFPLISTRMSILTDYHLDSPGVQTLNSPTGRPFYLCRFSPEGRYLLTISDAPYIEIWKLNIDNRFEHETQLQLRSQKSEIHTIYFSPSGQRIVALAGNSSSGHVVESWDIDDADTFIQRPYIEVEVKAGYEKFLVYPPLSLDGRYIANLPRDGGVEFLKGSVY